MSAAERLRAASLEGRPVRFTGAGTKLSWGAASGDFEPVEITDRTIHEHNEGDLTAVVDAGVRLRDLQETLAGSGQMLALDPPLGPDATATLGGIVATGDSGPLRHKYGSARDLVVGMTVALSDGTVAQSGGKVIKNVAGYDLSKLFIGSYGTLGAVLKLSVRLHPVSPRNATAVGRSGDPAALAGAAAELSHARIELQSLDVSWERGAGAVLARFGGADASAPAGRAAATDGLSRTGHRGARGRRRGLGRAARGPALEHAAWWCVSRACRPSSPTVLRTAERLGARVVGRAGLGLSWVTLPASGDAGASVEALRAALSPVTVRGARRPARAAPEPRCMGPPRPGRDGADGAGQGALRRRRGLRSRECSHERRADPPGRRAAAGRGLGLHPPARARPDRRLRALRLLPAHLSHLRALGRGGRLARGGGSC